MIIDIIQKANTLKPPSILPNSKYFSNSFIIIKVNNKMPRLLKHINKTPLSFLKYLKMCIRDRLKIYF